LIIQTVYKLLCPYFIIVVVIVYKISTISIDVPHCTIKLAILLNSRWSPTFVDEYYILIAEMYYLLSSCVIRFLNWCFELDIEIWQKYDPRSDYCLYWVLSSRIYWVAWPCRAPNFEPSIVRKNLSSYHFKADTTPLQELYTFANKLTKIEVRHPKVY
jgi:hypothetical protein